MMKNQNKKSETPRKQPIRYWMVEFTLTSGEVKSFYIKARTQFDAYQKADEYQFWLENPILKNKLNFRLMP